MFKKKKWIKYILLLVAFLIIIQIIIFFAYGSINLSGTFKTKYYSIENSDYKIIQTQFFKIKTPKSWIHIFGGYGMEGNPFGSFQTLKGVIQYEYGPFAPDYNEDDDIYNYKVEKRQINQFIVNIARNNKNETGICIPMQGAMQSKLTFYMDKSVTKNFIDLIKGIEKIEFK